MILGSEDLRASVSSQMVAFYAFNSSTQEAEAGRSQGVLGQPGIQNEFQDSQGYIIERLYLREEKSSCLAD